MYQDTIHKDSIRVQPEPVLVTPKATPIALPIVERKPEPVKKVIKKAIVVKEPEMKPVIDTFQNPYPIAEKASFSIYTNDTVADSASFTTQTTQSTNRVEQLPFDKQTTAFNSLFVFLSIGIGFLLILLNQYYNNLTELILNSAVNKQLSSRALREKNIALRRSFSVLNLLSVIVYAFFIWFGLNFLHETSVLTHPKTSFFIALGLLTTLLLIRFVLQKVLAKLFLIEDFMLNYLHNNYNLLKASAILILPLLFFTKFSTGWLSDTFFLVAVLVFIIMLIYKYLRAIQLLFQFRFLNLFSILYFCTLEILPVILGLKFIKNLI